MSRESKAIKDEIQRNRDEAYLNGWDDGYAEGYGKATADAPTFTAADLERAWRIGRDYVCNMVPSNWDMTRIAMKSPPADLAQRVKE